MHLLKHHRYPQHEFKLTSPPSPPVSTASLSASPPLPASHYHYRYHHHHRHPPRNATVWQSLYFYVPVSDINVHTAFQLEEFFNGQNTLLFADVESIGEVTWLLLFYVDSASSYIHILWGMRTAHWSGALLTGALLRCAHQRRAAPVRSSAARCSGALILQQLNMSHMLPSSFKWLEMIIIRLDTNIN